MKALLAIISFQPGDGPSRGLLRDYEHSCGPSFAALVCREFPVGREPAGGLLHPLERGRAQQPVRGGGLRVLDQQGMARRRLLQKQTGRYLIYLQIVDRWNVAIVKLRCGWWRLEELCRVTMGHLRVTIGHLRLTIGYL